MKNMNKLMKVIWLSVWFLFSIASAEAQIKHPRVAELEKSLAKEGLELLKGRFPEKPFLLTVRIDPMMRDRKSSGEGGERLPYFETSNEEFVDEWDDPSVPNTALLNRVRKIYLNVSIPSNLTDDEIAELKATLINNLGMIDARDAVEINKRNWGTLERNSGFSLSWLLWALGGWLLIMAGFFAISYFSTARLSSAMKETGGQNQKTPPPAPVQPSANFNHDQTNMKSAGSHGGDLKFNDPFKNREMIASGVKMLESHRSFPSLEDMAILNRFAVEKPNECGALLTEFPIGLRTKIFGYSFGPAWLNAMTDPSEVSSQCVETLNRCLRLQRNDLETDWQELLILVWRLQDKRKDFFKGMNQSESFSILSSLPKGIALEVARELFPGAWGLLLDPEYKSTKIAANRIKELVARAIEIEPLRDLSILAKYKNEKELLQFLKTVEPNVEKEIYQAAGDDFLIQKIRPPYYMVLEGKEEQIRSFVPHVRIEDWALAMFNVSRMERKIIEGEFSEKQKFRYFEILRSFDSNPPSKQRIGDVREKIGFMFHQHCQQMANAAPVFEEKQQAA